MLGGHGGVPEGGHPLIAMRKWSLCSSCRYCVTFPRCRFLSLAARRSQGTAECVWGKKKKEESRSKNQLDCQSPASCAFLPCTVLTVNSSALKHLSFISRLGPAARQLLPLSPLLRAGGGTRAAAGPGEAGHPPFVCAPPSVLVLMRMSCKPSDSFLAELRVPVLGCSPYDDLRIWC